MIGRHPRGNIIAYQIRQSFKPGEITPEEANQVGYETAMRFTKGNHAFIVATHTDKAHIHNHIIFNSTSLDCTHKFRDFFFVGLALQRLSDIICLEHGLSVIEKKKPCERVKRTTCPEKKSFRDDIRDVINQILREGGAKDFNELLYKLEDAGYKIKRGKHISLSVIYIASQLVQINEALFVTSKYSIPETIDSINKMLKLELDEIGKTIKEFPDYAELYQDIMMIRSLNLITIDNNEYKSNIDLLEKFISKYGDSIVT